MKKILIYTFLIILSLPSQAQNKKGYKYLEKSDYPKAKETFKKELITDKDNIGANFGLALVYADEKSPDFNLLLAWRHLNMIKDILGSITQDDIDIIKEYYVNTDNRRGRYPARKNIEYIIEGTQERLIKFIREENNLQMTYSVLESFPDFKYYKNIIHIRNQLEYRKYEKQNSIDAFNEFLAKFPDAAQVEKAVKARNKLAFVEAKRKNTLAAYKEFLLKYSDSEDYQAALKLRNAAAFEEAKRMNTMQAYERFIEEYPDALEVANARNLMKVLLYEYAKRIQSLEAYNDFISKYPEGKYYIDIFNLKSLDLGKKYMAQNSVSLPFNAWTRGYDNNKAFDIASDLEITPENNYILAGTTKQHDTSYTNAWIVKLDENGKMLWNEVVGEKYNDEVVSVKVNKTGEIIVAGHTYLTPDSVSKKGWVFKLGADGKRFWSRSLDRMEIRDMVINSEDQIILGGSYINDSSVKKNLIFVLNNEGKRLWKRIYTRDGSINDLVLSDNDNIILAGDTWIANMSSKGYLNWNDTLSMGSGYTCINNISGNDFAGVASNGTLNMANYDHSGNTGWKSTIHDAPFRKLNSLISYQGKYVLLGETFLNVTVAGICRDKCNGFDNNLNLGRVKAACITTDKKGNMIILLSGNDFILIKNSGI